MVCRRARARGRRLAGEPTASRVVTARPPERFPAPAWQSPRAPLAPRRRGQQYLSWLSPPAPGRLLDGATATQVPGTAKVVSTAETAFPHRAWGAPANHCERQMAVCALFWPPAATQARRFLDHHLSPTPEVHRRLRRKTILPSAKHSQVSGGIRPECRWPPASGGIGPPRRARATAGGR